MKIVLPPGVLYDQALLDTTAQLLLGEITDAQVIPKAVGTLEHSHHVASHPEERRADINAAEPYARWLYYTPDQTPVKAHEREGGEVKAHTRKGRPVRAHQRKATTVKAHYVGKPHIKQGDNQNAKPRWFEDWVPGGKEGGRAAQIYAALWAKKYGGK